MSTYEPIASQTLSSTAASVTFSSIPQGYTDIRAVVVTAVNTSTYMRFNSDSGANYSLTEMWAGTSPISERATNNTRIDLRNSSSTLGNNMATVDIMNYSNSTTNKTLLTAIRDGLYDRVYRQVQLWRNTAAITTITFVPDTGTFPSGSTFSLYGIQVGDKAQKAQGGNIVTSDGTYVYHTFTSSGAFIPSQALTVDYLVVAGGGGANTTNNSGGGGGGGLRSTVTATGGGGSLESALSLSSGKSYPVIVGAGGAYSVSGFNSGSNSVFASITAIGGGGGGAGLDGSYGVGTGNNGGSGGGGGTPVNTGVTNSGGTGTANQGYAGGSSVRGAPYYGAGGGGGAGATGNGGSGDAGGAGGNGVAVAISGTSTYYAGGGGGGHNDSSVVSGGLGGGGTGGRSGASAGAGSPNTGGGGGGSGNANTAGNGLGAAGGSGIVIIRYAV